jgi:hypothetical protein
MWGVIKKNPISAFAVLLVAFVGGFLVYMAVWQTTILASPSWCAKALGAEKIAPGQDPKQILESLKSCNEMLLVQLNAIAVDSHIGHGTFAIVIIVLIVVVIAGARASWKLSTTGFEGSVSREEPTPVTVVNPPSEPVPTAEARPKFTAPPGEQL